jgi:predicted permease
MRYTNDDAENMSNFINKRDEAFRNLFSNLFQASVAFVAIAVPLLLTLNNMPKNYFWLCLIGCLSSVISAFITGTLLWYDGFRYVCSIKEYAKSCLSGKKFKGVEEYKLVRFFRKIVFFPLIIALLLFVIAACLNLSSHDTSQSVERDKGQAVKSNCR